MTVTLSNTPTLGVPVVTVGWVMGMVAAFTTHTLLKKEDDNDQNSFINIDNVFIAYFVMLITIIIFGVRSIILYLSSSYAIAPSPLEHDDYASNLSNVSNDETISVVSKL